MAQIRLSTPVMMNAISQLCATMAHTTSGGASMPPIDEPTLK